MPEIFFHQAKIMIFYNVRLQISRLFGLTDRMQKP